MLLVSICNRHYHNHCSGQHAEIVWARWRWQKIFTDLKIEASKSSKVSVFSKFKKHFESVSHTNKEILVPRSAFKYSRAAPTNKVKNLQCD